MVTLNNVLEKIRTQLSLEGSPLASFSRPGNLYFLLRAISAAIVDVLNAPQLALLETSVGVELDRRASEFNITRLEGENAQGYVLLRSTERRLLEAGTILQVENSTFRLLFDTTVDGIELSVPVEATQAGRRLISAGTLVSSRLHRSMRGEVGRYRDPNGLPIGDINSGIDRESDESLRERVREYRSLPDRGTYRALRSELINRVPNLGKVAIEEGNGSITVYTDVVELTTLFLIDAVVREYRPLGISYTLRPFITTPYRLRLSVRGNADTGLIRRSLGEYFESLPGLVSPSIDSILSTVRSTGAGNPSLLESLVPLPTGGLAVLESVEVINIE